MYGYDAEGYNEDGYDQEGNHRDESEEGDSKEQDGTPGSDEPPGSYDTAAAGPSQPQPIPRQHAAAHPGHMQAMDPASLAAFQHIRQYGTPVAPRQYSAPQAPLPTGSQAASHPAPHEGPRSGAASLHQRAAGPSLLSSCQRVLDLLHNAGPQVSVKAEQASAAEPAAEARRLAHAGQTPYPAAAQHDGAEQYRARTQERHRLELFQAMGAGKASVHCGP